MLESGWKEIAHRQNRQQKTAASFKDYKRVWWFPSPSLFFFFLNLGRGMQEIRMAFSLTLYFRSHLLSASEGGWGYGVGLGGRKPSFDIRALFLFPVSPHPSIPWTKTLSPHPAHTQTPLHSNKKECIRISVTLR